MPYLPVGRNLVIVIKEEMLKSHAPVVMIPIRSGETATLQVPLGRYRITYAPNAAWQGDFKLLGEAQEGIEPLEFYRTGNQRMGHAYRPERAPQRQPQNAPCQFFLRSESMGKSIGKYQVDLDFWLLFN